MSIDAGTIASEATLQEWCDRIGGDGYRGTGTAAHERIIRPTGRPWAYEYERPEVVSA